MKTVGALFALCALFVGPAPRTLAQDDHGQSARPPGGRGTGSARPSAGNPKVPAARSDEQGDSTDSAPRHREETLPSDPYARDPYDTELPDEGNGAAEDESPTLGAPSGRDTQESEDPYPTDQLGTDPYDDGEN